MAQWKQTLPETLEVWGGGTALEDCNRRLEPKIRDGKTIAHTPIERLRKLQVGFILKRDWLQSAKRNLIIGMRQALPCTLR